MMGIRKKEEKGFVIPTAPSSTTYESLLSEDFSVDAGGGIKTDVSVGEKAEQRAPEPVEDSIQDMIDSPNAAEVSFGALKRKIEAAKSPVRSEFARFRELYSSKDGKLCVYEDADGHIFAVDASKLA